MPKLVTISLLLAFFAVIAGGCGTVEIPDTMDISGDVDFGEDDYQQIVTANNELGFKMLEEVDVDENGNSFISPLSLFIIEVENTRDFNRGMNRLRSFQLFLLY